MSIQIVFSILAMAIQLLTASNQPGVSLELHQQAITVANSAIATAMQYIGENPTQTVANTVPSLVLGTGTTPVPQGAPAPMSTPVAKYSVKVLNSTITKDGGDVGFQIIDQNGRPVLTNGTDIAGADFVMYDLLRLEGGRQKYVVNDGCTRSANPSPSYSFHFNGLQDNPNVVIDPGNNLTIHVEFCGNVAEGKIAIGN